MKLLPKFVLCLFECKRALVFLLAAPMKTVKPLGGRGRQLMRGKESSCQGLATPGSTTHRASPPQGTEEEDGGYSGAREREGETSGEVGGAVGG